MRVIGLDVSRSVVGIAYLEEGQIKAGGGIDVRHEALQGFGAKLRKEDMNTAAIGAALKPTVERVVVANPLQLRNPGQDGQY